MATSDPHPLGAVVTPSATAVESGTFTYACPPMRTKPRSPAWRSEADDEERALHDEERWEVLCSLLLARLDTTTSAVPRARFLLRLAGVLEDGLGDRDQAFDGLVEAYLSTPADPQVLDELERLATLLGRFRELYAASNERLATNAVADRIPLLANVVRWLEGPLESAVDALPYREELARIDPSHPVVLLLEASAAHDRGASHEHVELLLRALERTRRDCERADIYEALAAVAPTPDDAFRYCGAALELLPDDAAAIAHFESAAMRAERFAEAGWALERIMKLREGAERADARLRLAELLEQRFLKHDHAIALLHVAIEEDPKGTRARLALERCYLALRDHKGLRAAVCERAKWSATPELRAEAFAFAAEIAETQDLDLRAALELLGCSLVASPNNREYLGRAAKLAERLDDTKGAFAYRTRLIGLLEDPEEKARQFVAMAARSRDPRERRRFYERALDEAPGHIGAWEGLEHVAAELGDNLATPAALRRGIAATSAPRRKAQLLLRLGAQLVKSGDRKAAYDACDEALRVDPSSERAASVMLERLVEQKRHGEALSACEVLLAAAMRDSNRESAIALIEKVVFLALALGDAQKALTTCLSATETFAKGRHLLVALADAVSACVVRQSAASKVGSDPALTQRISRALDTLVERRAELPAASLCLLAKALSSRDEPARAVLVLAPMIETLTDEGAGLVCPWPLELVRDALETATRASEATGDYLGATRTRLRLARISSDEPRFDLLLSAIDMLVHRVDHPRGAVPVIEEALALKPFDLPLLHTAMSVFGSLRDWERLAPIVGRMAQLQTVPERRAKYLFTQAQIVDTELGRKRHAAALYDDVLDADKSRLDVFATLTRLYDQIGDYKGLERSYRKMIARVQHDGDEALLLELFKKLSCVYSNRLGDVASAEKAIAAAKRLEPNDMGLNTLAVDIHVRGEELDRAVSVLRKDIRRDPHDPRTYERLHEMFLRQGRLDSALATAQILADLRPSTPHEVRLLGKLPARGHDSVSGCLSETAWDSHLTHPDLDATVTNLFATMTRIFCRMNAPAKTGLARATDASEEPRGARGAIADACEILSLPGSTPIFGRWGNPAPFLPCPPSLATLLVDVDAARWARPLWSYLLGKRICESRPELAARAFFPGDRGLKALAALGLEIGMGSLPTRALSKADAKVFREVTPQERSALSTVYEAARARGGKLDLRKWSQAVDLTSARVGLLLSQDVRVARRAITSEAQGPHDLSPKQKLGELFIFATSDLYFELREAIGVAAPTSRAVPRASLQSFSLLSA